MRFLKNPNWTVAILFVYTTCMYIYFFPRNHEMSNNEKWAIIGGSLCAAARDCAVSVRTRQISSVNRYSFR